MKDLTGMVFNRLTAIRPNGKSKKGNYKWDCICLCGKEITVESTNLISGNTNSCGCYREDRLLEYSTTHGYSGGQHNNATDWANKIGAYEENLRRMMKKKSFSDCVNYYLFNKRKRTCKKRFTI